VSLSLCLVSFVYFTVDIPKAFSMDCNSSQKLA
jgi:hypothetical protein